MCTHVKKKKEGFNCMVFPAKRAQDWVQKQNKNLVVCKLKPKRNIILCCSPKLSALAVFSIHLEKAAWVLVV